ncbi:MAG: hypothetical protein ABII06_03185 [Pseudomonadota bacterium]
MMKKADELPMDEESGSMESDSEFRPSPAKKTPCREPEQELLSGHDKLYGNGASGVGGSPGGFFRRLWFPISE